MVTAISFETWVSQRGNRGSDFFFIQIGANDGQSIGGEPGVTDDPIYRYVMRFGWSGILVEPVKYLFDRLRETYKGQPHLIFENVAIASTRGRRELYRLRETTAPVPWFYDKLGSFYLDVVLKEDEPIPNIRQNITTEIVECITFSDLIAKHSVDQIDLLQIDTEGHDYEIIKTVDFDSVRPAAILYEHKHLSDSDCRECRELLDCQGYRYSFTEHDTFAYSLPRA